VSGEKAVEGSKYYGSSWIPAPLRTARGNAIERLRKVRHRPHLPLQAISKGDLV
jgi:hypothetical protein